MANTYNSKVILDDEVLIDLTQDSITAADLKRGVTAHDKSGAPITGTNDYDVDSSNVTASESEVLANKTFAKAGTIKTGTMPNRGGVTGTITDKSTPYTIPQGYHDGSGTVSISAADAAKLVADNIKSGIEILGVTGTHTGEEDLKVTQATITPSFDQQTVVPAEGYDYLSQVIVRAIPVTRTDNSAGGVTVTIG